MNGKEEYQLEAGNSPIWDTPITFVLLIINENELEGIMTKLDSCSKKYGLNLNK